jgi:hypothetical protein
VEVEFLDPAPAADGAAGESPGGRGRRLVVIGLVLLVLAGAVLVARRHGGTGPAETAASAVPHAISSETVHSAGAIRGATLGEAGQVALPVVAIPACHRPCTVALFVPGAVLDAVHDRFPNALVTSQFSVSADADRALLDRGLTATLGRGRVEVALTRRGVPRPPALPGRTIEFDRAGYHVRVTAIGVDVSARRLTELAGDRRLLTAD